jgi:hypothetical protein
MQNNFSIYFYWSFSLFRNLSLFWRNREKDTQRKIERDRRTKEDVFDLRRAFILFWKFFFFFLKADHWVSDMSESISLLVQRRVLASEDKSRRPEKNGKKLLYSLIVNDTRDKNKQKSWLFSIGKDDHFVIDSNTYISV